MVKAELDSTKDYYKVLGIGVTSSQADIRKAFLDLARTHHPDKNPGHEALYKAKFQVITTAYDVLKDPTSKRTYDQIRPIPRKSTQQRPAASKTTNKPAQTPTSKTPNPSTFPRAQANQRQDKTASGTIPRTNPKRAPTASREPFSASNKDSSADRRPGARDIFGERLRSTLNQHHPPRTKSNAEPSAAHSAFYHASPASPRVNVPPSSARPASKASFTKTNQSPSSTPQPNVSQTKSAPDWTLKEDWWSRSNTAYSRFHASSLNFSPNPPPARNSMAQKAQSPARPYQDPAKPDRSETPTKTPFNAATNDTYAWLKSETAYQHSSSNKSRTSPARSSQKEPFVKFTEDIRAGNPFFTSRMSAGTGSSSAMDNDLQNLRSRSAPRATQTSTTPITNSSFKFDFKPSPESITRASNSKLPPVKFNVIPDFDFSSSKGDKDWCSGSPFGGSLQQDIFNTPHADSNKNSKSSAEKHAPVDPNEDLSNLFAKTSLNPETSSRKFESKLQDRSTISEPYISETTRAQNSPACSQRRSSSKAPSDRDSRRRDSSANSSASSSSASTAITEDGCSKVIEAPMVPEALLTACPSHDISEEGLPKYLAQCAMYNAYSQAWHDYEARLLTMFAEKPRTTIPASYCTALKKHRVVCQAHLETIDSHAGWILAQPPRP